MEMNIGNTVSNPAGDGGNKENDLRLLAVPPRPRRRNRPQQSVASVGYHLGPRTKLAKKDFDFAIYEDETAHEIPQPRREYYGSNLPVFPDITNGQTYKYALTHVMNRDFDELMDEAIREQDTSMRITGLYHWVAGCDPLDVWLSVQDKGYHRRWNEDQRQGFKRFLKWMELLVKEAGDYKDCPAKMAIDERNTADIIARFGGLDLQNLTIEKAKLSVFFTPGGEDRHVIYRRDFIMEEESLIDILWPEYWGVG
ncbi:hypothetical protein GGI43DRAFT_384898 [Trichoderma evansii]